jgi:hypothetical protein
VHSTKFGEDLIIVASDTPGTATTANSDRVLGSEFFRELLAIGKQSIVFAFFDTCSSGSLKNVSEYFQGSFNLRWDRIVSVASSGASQESYNFEFTDALLQHWEGSSASSSKDCEHYGGCSVGPRAIRAM